MLLGLKTGLLFLDQEKAFDRVEHGYLWTVLENLGFSSCFIAMIKVLYSDIESVLKVNGGLSAPFQVNWAKSEVFLVGEWKGEEPRPPDSLHWKKGGFKYLGVYLGDGEVMKKNWEDVLERIKGRLMKWKWLVPKMSYRDRVLIINNLAASWVRRKGEFGSLMQWWDVGKAQIRIFCQDFTSFSTSKLRYAIGELERDIMKIHDLMINRNVSDLRATLVMKLQDLSDLLQEKAKRALVGSRFVSVQDMDAPTAFFFNLEKSSHKHESLVSVRKDDGTVKADSAKVKRLAVDFYSELFTASALDQQCSRVLSEDLPQLDEQHLQGLDTALTFEEVTRAVFQLVSGRVPGIDD
ncbi:hypothetical protein NFI96_030780 [Prochilodus magdalenae]|nr:hypothetical protein NFI96_030780 [Prochilodus magdalenae]